MWEAASDGGKALSQGRRLMALCGVVAAALAFSGAWVAAFCTVAFLPFALAATGLLGLLLAAVADKIGE